MSLRPPHLFTLMNPAWAKPWGGSAEHRPLSPRPATPSSPTCSFTCVKISTEQAAKRKRTADPLRERACKVFASFLDHFRSESKLAQQMIKSNEQFHWNAASLQAALAAKKTETLRKRAGSPKMYWSWLGTSCHLGEPFSEQAVFDFFQAMVAERVPPSRGLTMPQMLAFIGGIFGVATADALRSPRIRGLAVRIR